MAVNFPDNPVHGQVFGTWTYDSTVPGWRSTPEAATGLPAGSIMAWGGATAPTNWLICNGNAISRSTYASLFSAIGVMYGAGDGSTTFNLPDLRGRVPVGLDATQSEFNTIAETGGSKTTAKYGDGTTTGYGLIYTSSLGTGDASGLNLPPYQVFNYVIKYSAGVTAGDSELATRVGVTETVNTTQNGRLTTVESRATALELATTTTNLSGLVPIIPSSLTVTAGTASTASDGTTSFNSCTGLRLNGIFSSVYSNYLILCEAETTGTAADIYGQLVTSGGTALASGYVGGRIAVSNTGSVASNWQAASGVIILSRTNGANGFVFEANFINPFTAKQKKITTNFAEISTIGMQAYINPSTTSYTALTFYANGTTMNSGTVKVYGYR